MAQPKSFSFDLPDEYSTQARDIQRRQQMADMLQQQAQTPLETNRMAGGYVVPIHPLEGLAKLMAGMQARSERKGADEQAVKLAQLMQQNRADTIQRAEQAAQGMPEIAAPTEEMGGGPGRPAIPGDAKTARGILAQSKDPMLQQMAMQMLMKDLEPQKPVAVGKSLVDPKTGKALYTEKPDQWAKINPKDYTPESVAKFAQTQNQADLVPARKMEVGPAGQIWNPWTAQPGQVMNDPNKPFAIGQGGALVPNTPFQNYEMGKANAGATRVQNLVNAYTPASEEAQKDFMKGLRGRYDQLQSAPATLDNIEKAKALVPKAGTFVGSGAQAKLSAVKFLNNNIGTNISLEGVKSAEELNSRLFMGIMENLKKMDSQPSQSQQAALQKGLGEIGTDPQALPRVLDVFGDIVRQKVDIHNQEAKGAMERGVKFPYDPMIKLPQTGVGLPSVSDIEAELARRKGGR